MKIHDTLKNHILIDENAIVVNFEKSHGSWLVDENGKEYLDCFSQFASQPLGWNHPKIVAQKDRLVNAALHKIANSDMLCKEYGEFVEAFVSVTPDFKHHFFISGGALAVENALKAAFDWKAQKLGWDSNTKRDDLTVVHFREAFHGRTGYTLSLTNSPHSNLKIRYFPKFHWSRVINPKMTFPLNETKVRNLEQGSLQEIKGCLSRNNVAAILLEPIQGEGGDNHFRKEYFQQLKELVDEHETLLIFDEVQTGLGLTGKMWAYEHFGIVPDLISFGKKTQVCGCSSTEKIDEVQDNVFRLPSRINSTWGGNIVDMVRSTINIEIIKEDKLVENAEVVGNYFLQQLKELGLENARGRGLMLAFDLQDEAERDKILERLGNDMLALACGPKSIRFRPHLTFTEPDVDVAIDFIKKAL